MEKFALTNEEEKSLVGILYNHITFGTTMEVFGELTPSGVKRLNDLRKVLEKFLIKYELSSKLNSEAYLTLGMADFIEKNLMEKWAENGDNKHLQNRAKYFLKQIRPDNDGAAGNIRHACGGFPKTIKIGNREIGEGRPVYIIADIGANFDGNLDKAKKLAIEVKEAGGDVVKIQSFLADKIVSAKGFSSMRLKGVHGSWGRPVDEIFKEAEFPREWHKEFFDYCKNIGIAVSSSPYDFEAVDLMDEIGVDFYKIGSGDITWLEMLEYIARKNKPIILATGASALAEVDEAVNAITSTGNKNLILLQCITNYPSKIESANINVLKTYQQAYDIITGYSDHSPGDTVVLGAVALGAKVIEKHFTLNKNDQGPDHPHSMNPEEFYNMTQRIRQLEKAMGTGRKTVVEEEAETVIVQRRSLYARTAISKEEAIRRDNVIELRPALGILPKYKPLIIGRRVKRDIMAGEPLKWEDIL